jgi:hypothetical protein
MLRGYPPVSDKLTGERVNVHVSPLIADDHAFIIIIIIIRRVVSSEARLRDARATFTTDVSPSFRNCSLSLFLAHSLLFPLEHR